MESELSVFEARDSVVIELRGTCDVCLAQRFADAALHCVEAGRDTTLDCAALERIDASALQIMLALRKALSARSHGLWLANVPDNVGAYLQLAGVGGLLSRGAASSDEAADASDSLEDSEETLVGIGRARQ